MGKRILEETVGQRWKFAAEIPPDLLRQHAAQCLPKSMRGENYRSRYGGVDDPLSSVQTNHHYPVRAALDFPVKENARCGEAARILSAGDDPQTASRRIGELLYASHEGYRAMGLSCPEVDAMVATVHEHGYAAGFFGARVSGGGSGGTVVVLLEEKALPRLEALAHSPVPGQPAPFVR
jgi:L-arabinokinase